MPTASQPAKAARKTELIGEAMRFFATLALLWTALAGAAAATQDGVDTDGVLTFQRGVTPITDQIHWFNTFTLWIIIPIALFVIALLVWVMIRYNAKANPEPSKNAHNTVLEVVWTAVPVLILLAISVFSFPLLYFSDTIPSDPDGDIPPAEFTLKATGHQWYWSYEYPDHDVSGIVANMVAEDDLQPGQVRNLSTDYPIVIPVDTTIRLQVTADTVIHNWAMPSFGTKLDAIPGRLNETWIHAREVGVYYGQCSELCGVNHAFMPIEVRVLPQEQYETWLERVAESTNAGNEYLQSVQPLGSQVALAQ